MATTTYIVTATHPHPEYCFDRTEVKVSQDAFDRSYYATHPKLGCGKNYGTPQQAIRALFNDHACSVVRIDNEPPQKPARRTLKQMTDAECIEAYRLNQRGEGAGYISNYGEMCSQQTVTGMINRGERLVKAMPAPITTHDVERLKSDGRYRHAGALAWALGMDANYGCHFGMRSTRDHAIYEYQQGWAGADFDSRNHDRVSSSQYVASAFSFDRD